MYTIVGLGNEGEEYVSTRHNVGRDVVLAWVKHHGGSCVSAGRYSGYLWEGALYEKVVRAFIPQSFMNESGGPVRKIVEGTPIETLIVVHDDLDLPLGTVRVAFGRGAGGHNGVSSIIETLRSNEFIRVRIGISKEIEGTLMKPKEHVGVPDFVLGTFSKKEMDVISSVEKRIFQILDALIEQDVDRVMNTFNG